MYKNITHYVTAISLNLIRMPKAEVPLDRIRAVLNTDGLALGLKDVVDDKLADQRVLLESFQRDLADGGAEKSVSLTPSGAAVKAHGVKQLEEGLGLGIVDAGLEFRAYMLDMYLLAEGSAFLGAFTSNAARLAYSLMSSGTEGCLKPYVSFDINWCYAMEKGGPGVVRKGAKSCREDAKCHAQRADTIGC